MRGTLLAIISLEAGGSRPWPKGCDVLQKLGMALSRQQENKYLYPTTPGNWILPTTRISRKCILLYSAPKRNRARWHLAFSLMRPTPDLSPTNCKVINLFPSNSLCFMLICYSSSRKLIWILVTIFALESLGNQTITPTCILAGFPGVWGWGDALGLICRSIIWTHPHRDGSRRRGLTNITEGKDQILGW